jgi:hypothetical protein
MALIKAGSSSAEMGRISAAIATFLVQKWSQTHESAKRFAAQSFPVNSDLDIMLVPGPRGFVFGEP